MVYSAADSGACTDTSNTHQRHAFLPSPSPTNPLTPTPPPLRLLPANASRLIVKRERLHLQVQDGSLEVIRVALRTGPVERLKRLAESVTGYERATINKINNDRAGSREWADDRSWQATVGGWESNRDRQAVGREQNIDDEARTGGRQWWKVCTMQVMLATAAR